MRCKSSHVLCCRFPSSFPTAHTNLYLRRVLPLLRLHPH
uniref:Uncharacterized protein n=1 Tax=virus sp. ctReX5 TaxID=2825818 RepID=A0A8S5RKV8_9VIRU|nr:MAG TPA: hypothetical protein [virus sp. ctReX5]DAK73283.1 MAG TPA: hypothetical protein [Bacteriophage sp.]